VTLAYQPNVSVPDSGTVRLDARPGRRVEVSLNDPGARQVMATALVAQHTDAGLVPFPSTPVRVEDFQRTPVFVTPDDTVTAALSLYTDARPGHASGARPYAGVTGTTATAHDQAGNGVDQTVIRAFGLT
jgi:hypothetical protein